MMAWKMIQIRKQKNIANKSFRPVPYVCKELGPEAWTYCKATNNEDTGEVNCNVKKIQHGRYENNKIKTATFDVRNQLCCILLTWTIRPMTMTMATQDMMSA